MGIGNLVGQRLPHTRTHRQKQTRIVGMAILHCKNREQRSCANISTSTTADDTCCIMCQVCSFQLSKTQAKYLQRCPDVSVLSKTCEHECIHTYVHKRMYMWIQMNLSLSRESVWTALALCRRQYNDLCAQHTRFRARSKIRIYQNHDTICSYVLK